MTTTMRRRTMKNGRTTTMNGMLLVPRRRHVQTFVSLQHPDLREGVICPFPSTGDDGDDGGGGDGDDDAGERVF
jgi:hypothetical protein